MNSKKKKCFTIFFFKPNNMLTKFFKELTKYKNDNQQYLNYIYKNYIIYLIVYL